MTALVRLAFLALLMATGLLAGSQVGAVEPTAASEHSVFAYDGDSVVAIDTTATAPRSEGLMVAQILPVEAFSAVGPVYDSSADFVAPGSAADDLLGAACRTNSFVPGTLVLMADGSTEPIEDVEIGEWVWAHDPETGEAGARRVVDTIVGDGEKQLVDIEVLGDTVIATGGHPFWVEDEGRWVDADDLEVGDRLLLADGGTASVTAIEDRSAIRRVHNLTVDGIHTYYVQAGGEHVLVHNCRTIVGPGGVELPGVPDGAQGVLSPTGRGMVYDLPTGTPGIDPRVTQLRIMDPLTTGPYQYPNGYAVYMNASGQTVNPLTGRTVSNADPFAHIPLPSS